MTVLNSTEQEAISKAIADVESKTAGELVVAVVPKSDDYAKRRFLTAILWTLGITGLVGFLLPEFASVQLLLVQIPVLAISYWLTGTGPIIRLIAQGDGPDKARQRAMRMFAERGVHQTRDRSGLLIMLSELEHQVVILGDAGIHAKVGDPGWEGYVQRIITGLQQKKAGEAVVTVLQDLGEILATHFPAREDDTNELSNQVVVES